MYFGFEIDVGDDDDDGEDDVADVDEVRGLAPLSMVF